ncbi:MAG: hypothetical protein ACFFAD_14015 [Candidatus Hermodarchaeota archaeon]
MQVESVYIIRRDTGVCMYHHDFAEPEFDADLLSSFLVAMTSFFDEATRSVTSKARAFEGTDSKIIVEFGEWTLGAVTVREDTEIVREKVKRLIDAFEDQFGLLRWVDLDLAVYTRFERNVIEEFVRDLIEPQTTMRLKRDWEFYTQSADVVSFLKLIPEVCTVQEAANFLEVPVELAMNMAAEAYWEKAITLAPSAKPDDIYQATSLIQPTETVVGISEDTARVLPELDGETPLSIAAERVKTSDLKRFLDEIAILAQRKAVELVSPAQATTVLYTAALQETLNRTAKILGIKPARSLFFSSRDVLTSELPWLAFVGLEEGVDVEIKTSLVSATVRGSITPETLSGGFRDLFQEFTRRMSTLMGSSPVNTILNGARRSIERQFPSTAFDIHWESFQVN